MRTVVARGHKFELFTYDTEIVTPSWIVRRDARDVLPADHVMTYHHSFGAGSPSLHSNLFRYEMLHQLGCWWMDLDVLLFHPHLPEVDEFYPKDARGILGTAVLKSRPGNIVLLEAALRSRSVDEHTAQWGQTGPELITELVKQHRRAHHVHQCATVFPLDFFEMEAFFDPSRFDEVFERCSQSPFIHIFHEFRRASGFPRNAGPPKGCFLDWMFEVHELDLRFPYRVEHEYVKRWFGNHIDSNTFKTLYQETKAELSNVQTGMDLSATPAQAGPQWRGGLKVCWQAARSRFLNRIGE
jgi:hypothetical protein